MQQLRAFHYAVVRAVPDLARDESINVGLVVLADDGTFADARFGDLSRVRKLDPRINLRPIALFEESITASLPVRGHQATLEHARSELSVERLAEWSREFGGIVRVSAPRVMLGQSGAALTDRLYEDLVAPRRAPSERRRDVVTRGELVAEFDREVVSWNLSEELISRGHHVHGRRADHLIDRSIQRPDRSVAAIVHAISFQAGDLADVYGARATLIVASEDLREETPQPVGAYALYADAPGDRANIIRESAELFNAKQITPINHRDMSALRGEVAHLLFA